MNVGDVGSMATPDCWLDVVTVGRVIGTDGLTSPADLSITISRATHFGSSEKLLKCMHRTTGETDTCALWPNGSV